MKGYTHTCGTELHFESTHGMRTVETVGGKKVYKAHCPKCKVYFSSNSRGKEYPKPATQGLRVGNTNPEDAMIGTRVINGTIVTVEREEFSESPRSGWDNLGTILYMKRSPYVLGDKGVSGDEMQEQEERKDVVVLPVYAYVHGGTVLSTAPFSCPWDSGRSGIIFVEKAKAREWLGKKRLSKKTISQIERIFRAELETLNQYMAGEVYAYSIKDLDGEVMETVGGFYDLDDCWAEAGGAVVS